MAYLQQIVDTKDGSSTLISECLSSLRPLKVESDLISSLSQWSLRSRSFQIKPFISREAAATTS